jgi:hypothetical protein
VDPAAAVDRHVELRDQAAHLLELRPRREHEQRVGALVGEDPHRRLVRARRVGVGGRYRGRGGAGAARGELNAPPSGHLRAVDLGDLVGERRGVAYSTLMTARSSL